MSKIQFQAIDWVANDYGSTYSAEDFEADNQYKDVSEYDIPKYNIKVFGKDNDGKAISLNIENYTPHFYLKLPNQVELNEKELDNFKEFVLSKMPQKLKTSYDKDCDEYYYTKKSLHDIVQLRKKDVWGFTNNEAFLFLRLSFYNDISFKFFARLFKNSHVIQGVYKKSTKLALYESNIEPYLRFLHKQNIQPSGWIEVEKNKCSKNRILPTKKNIKDYSVDWKWVKGYDSSSMAPFLIASFDIECNSSHGDFPLASKDYEKIAIELHNLYQKIAKYKEDEIKLILINALLSGFDETTDTEYKISKIYTKREPNIEKIKERLFNGLMDDIYIILKGKMLLVKDDTIYKYRKLSFDNDNDKENGEQSEKDKFKSIFRQGKEVQNTITIIIKQLTDKLSSIFPSIQGDQVIQIGTTFHKYGQRDCCYKHIVTLNSCNQIDGIEVVSVENEKDLIKVWTNMINEKDPDILTGYNILGFDFDFLYKRALELNIRKQFLKINRIKNHISEWKVQSLSSSALGDNELKYVKTEGRVIIDVMKIIQKDHKLDSFKLDFVSSVFISGKVSSIDYIYDSNNTKILRCKIDNISGINIDNFITVGDSQKMKVLNKDTEKKEICLEQKEIEVDLSSKKWGLAKDDVTPKEIFECQKGSADDRTRIAKYCIMDCALCNYLIIKLEILASNVGMSNVCAIPLSYIFTRGQGIKIFSFVAKQCKEDDFLIPVLDKDWKCELCTNKNSSFNDKCGVCKSDKPDDEGFEGAIVLDPIPGIYTENPIAVLDYASLYPSSMISENISHDSIVLDKKYDNLPGYEYINITYDIFEGKGDKKRKVGEETSRFAQFPNNEKGILPRILQKLLVQRKNTRKKIEERLFHLKDNTTLRGWQHSKNDSSIEIMTIDKQIVTITNDNIDKVEDVYNEFEKAVLDGLQLAFKTTANSLYGQVGSKTSQVFLKQLAASTTATGRNLILGAKEFIEQNFPYAKAIYGDTDSLFIDFQVKRRFDLDGVEAIQKTIDLGIDASNAFQKHLKPPHVLEYEKTFTCFCIFSKKRYVGNLFTFDPTKSYRKVMGLSLKRRDFANIHKIVYGGIIDIILKNNNVHDSILYFNKCIKDILEGKYPLEDFVITKTLKGHYKTPDIIVHKVLADRMQMRDKGSAPQANDRVPYAYILKKEKKNVKMLQGERIEDPKFIKEHNLPIDYEFYITNQIMNSVTQLYSLVLDQIPGLNKQDFVKIEKKLSNDDKLDKKKIDSKIALLKEKEVKRLLFDPYLHQLYHKKNNMRQITDFLTLCESV